MWEFFDNGRKQGVSYSLIQKPSFLQLSLSIISSIIIIFYYSTLLRGPSSYCTFISSSIVIIIIYVIFYLQDNVKATNALLEKFESNLMDLEDQTRHADQEHIHSANGILFMAVSIQDWLTQEKEVKQFSLKDVKLLIAPFNYKLYWKA